jgi:radical SAM superfamily enzyme YgiQ (UPF0313 family)
MALDNAYNGFEQGPIRPPSEANSLLIRVTRNCPWNKCRFCPVYKDQMFSRRPLDHVLKDIDKVAEILDDVLRLSGDSPVTREVVIEAGKDLKGNDVDALHGALHWISGGMESVFLQDANSLIIKPDELIIILNHLKEKFPFIKRITSYARSATIAKISDEDLKRIADAGLNRIHIGMESGSDNVLNLVEKGATKEKHIIAGKKVKAAGISLSEYVMPGLGGSKFSIEHAIETADALNQIDADFIRIRTLAIPNITPLYDDYMEKKFDKLTDIESAKELRLFIEKLNPDLNSVITSDHVLNLFEDVEGKISTDKDLMLEKIDSFFDLSDYDKMIYQVGRRLGLFRGAGDIKDPDRYERAREMAVKFNVTPENADHVIAELMKRFI